MSESRSNLWPERPANGGGPTGTDAFCRCLAQVPTLRLGCGAEPVAGRADCMPDDLPAAIPQIRRFGRALITAVHAGGSRLGDIDRAGLHIMRVNAVSWVALGTPNMGRMMRNRLSRD